MTKSDLTKQEVRAAFMALYWGQQCLRNKGWEPSFGSAKIGGSRLDYVHEDHYLSLRHISSLTDPEAKIVCEIFDVDYNNTEGSEAYFDLVGAVEWIEALFTESAGYYIDGYTGDQLLQAIDFLRSIGILIPYRGNSCEELIESGVAVYRKEGE